MASARRYGFYLTRDRVEKSAVAAPLAVGCANRVLPGTGRVRVCECIVSKFNRSCPPKETFWRMSSVVRRYSGFHISSGISCYSDISITL